MTDTTETTEAPIAFKQPDKPITTALQNGAAVTQEMADAELEMSIFADGFDVAANGKPIYTTKVPYFDYVFLCRLLSPDEREYVNRENEGIDADSKAIKNLPPGSRLAASEALAARSVAKDRWVVEKAVTGWTSTKWKTPIPFTAENRDKVGPDVWAAVADDLYAKSISGRCNSDNATNF